MTTVHNGLKSALYGSLALVATLAASTGHAQQKTLYIGMNGGNQERVFTQSVFGPFEKENNVKVVVVPGGSGDLLAKVQASKAKPQMHVMLLDDGVMYRAISMGLCERMKPNPYLQDLPATARIKGDMAVGMIMSMTGLAYNTKIFSEKGWAPPTSWKDLADPKYKGKVVVQSISASTFGLHAFLMINRLNGGDEKNVEPGFKAWPKTVGPNIIEYIPNSAKVAEMAQAGEVALFPYTPGQTALLKSRGIPVEYAQPKEGSVLLMAAECVIANNSEPELSQKLAAYLISPEAQAAALKAGSFPPSNRKTPAEGDAAKEKARIEGYASSSVVLDWDVVNEQRPLWNTRWNRTIER
ncbi:MAG: extracellular solute-binding protein [Comamonas sp.]